MLFFAGTKKLCCPYMRTFLDICHMFIMDRLLYIWYQLLVLVLVLGPMDTFHLVWGSILSPSSGTLILLCAKVKRGRVLLFWWEKKSPEDFGANLGKNVMVDFFIYPPMYVTLGTDGCFSQSSLQVSSLICLSLKVSSYGYCAAWIQSRKAC